jgi:Kef-type K+ transport system membrane component KefB
MWENISALGSNPLMALGLLLLCGTLLGRLAEAVRLPHACGYLLGGLLLAPAFTGVLTHAAVGRLAVVADFGLAFIAVSIGGSLNFRHLRRVGRQVAFGAVLQSVVCFAVVAAASVSLLMWAWSPDGLETVGARVAFSLILAGISTATAPALTLAVIRQYGARGALTDTLLGVVVVDDALCLIMFAIALQTASWVLGSGGTTHWAMVAGHIGGALVLGFVSGLALAWLLRVVRDTRLSIPLVLGAAVGLYELSKAAHLAELLTVMTLGVTLENVLKQGSKLFDGLEWLEEPIFVAFFAIAGAHFVPGAFVNVWPLAMLYVAARFAGKYFGGYVGVRAGGGSATVAKNLGLGLMPQAGVALGLVLNLTARGALGLPAEFLINLVLSTTVVFELAGPVFTRWALKNAGELGPAPLEDHEAEPLEQGGGI